MAKAKSKNSYKPRPAKIACDGKSCCICHRPLSMYNKNEYGLCNSCLTKAKRQSDPGMPVVLVQQIAKDIHDSSAKDALGKLR